VQILIVKQKKKKFKFEFFIHFKYVFLFFFFIKIGIHARLQLDGLNSFSLSPGKSVAIAAFIPERKGQPASVRIYSYPNFNQQVAAKSFFRADSAELFWNALGTNLLVLTHTDVDATGQSYYGETSLFYLSVAGNYDCRVTLGKPYSFVLPFFSSCLRYPFNRKILKSNNLLEPLFFVMYS